jgi:hypothetical protein
MMMRQNLFVVSGGDSKKEWILGTTSHDSFGPLVFVDMFKVVGIDHLNESKDYDSSRASDIYHLVFLLGSSTVCITPDFPSVASRRI